MKLNAQIIKEDLSDIFMDCVITGNVLDRRLRFPVLYNGEHILLGDRVYLAAADHIPSMISLENHPTLICAGRPDKYLFSGECDLILVDEDVWMENLLVRVLEIFDKYAAWETDIQKVVINNAPIKTLGELSDPIFENPIHLYDINLECIFTVFNSKRYALPPEYKNFEEYYRLDFEEINMLKMEPGFAEMAESKTPVLFESGVYGCSFLRQNIFFNGRFAGQINIDEINRKFSDKDFALIMVLADAVLNVMLNSGTLNISRPKEMDEMLTKMLSHKLVAEGVIESVLSKLGWEIQDEYFCLTIEPTDYDYRGNTLAFLTSRLSSVMVSRCYVHFDRKIIFVLNLKALGARREDLLTAIKPILRDSLLKAGISTVYTDFKNLYYYYRQSCIALETGKKKMPTHWYHKFDDYILDHIFASSIKGLIPDALCPEGLLRLRNYDALKGTQFTQALQTYLELDMNIAECTRKLYLHRNTFIYRIERAKKILDMNLEDPDVRLLLLIALRIVE